MGLGTRETEVGWVTDGRGLVAGLAAPRLGARCSLFLWRMPARQQGSKLRTEDGPLEEGFVATPKGEPSGMCLGYWSLLLMLMAHLRISCSLSHGVPVPEDPVDINDSRTHS